MIYLQVHYHFSGKFGIIYTLPCIILFPITAPVIRWVSKCACQSIKLRDSVLLRGDNFRCKWKVRARMFLVILNLLWKIYNMHFHTWRLYPPLLNTIRNIDIYDERMNTYIVQISHRTFIGFIFLWCNNEIYKILIYYLIH